MKSVNRRAITVGLETTYGQEEVPSVAIQCGNITHKPLAGGTVERKIIRPYFGNKGKIRIEQYSTLSFATEIVGAGMPGTAPPYAVLLKACNMSEVLTAADITGTAQAGGSTTTIKLANTESAVDDFYVGMTVSITAGTGNGKYGEIISYNGTTKIATVAVPFGATPDATSEYSIGANAIYIPNSTFGRAGSTSLTMYFNVDGTRHILLGARGTFKIGLSAKGIPEYQWEFTGLLGEITDVSLPTLDLSAWLDPVEVSTAYTNNINIMGYNSADLALESLNIDVGNKVVYRSLVGSESVIINDRSTSGDFSIEAMSVAEKDWWTDAKDGSYGPICIKHGQVAGNIVTFTGRNVQALEPDYGESDGVVMLKGKLDFTPKGVAGNDEFRICVK